MTYGVERMVVFIFRTPDQLKKYCRVLICNEYGERVFRDTNKLNEGEHSLGVYFGKIGFACGSGSEILDGQNGWAEISTGDVEDSDDFMLMTKIHWFGSGG